MYYISECFGNSPEKILCYAPATRRQFMEANIAADQTPSRVGMTIDLDATGRQTGDLRFKWSDNANPLGFVTIPVQSIKGQPGPTVLIMGGVHGDEFEGPAAILRLCDSLLPGDLRGQVILIPALNAPAFLASSRVSPLDGQNLNRAFPGDPNGGPTAMIADFIECELMPRLDAVIDLHSGGRASVFAPTALATRTGDPDLFARNLDLAEAFGMPSVWILSAFNDSRSVNSAAARAGVPMIAAELGGGGGVDPALVTATEAGLRRCLVSLGVLGDAGDAPAPTPAHLVEIKDLSQTVMAPARGLFDRAISAGDTADMGQTLGWLRFPEELDRARLPIVSPSDGFVLAHTNRGFVERGEFLVQLAQTVDR